MATLEELRRENARLRAEAAVERDFARRNAERKKLARENRALKYRKIYSKASQIGGAISSGARRIGNQYAKAQRSKKRSSRSSSGFGLNFARPSNRSPFATPRFRF